MRYLKLTISLLTVFFLCSCASVQERYPAQPNHKAFATGGNGSYGASWNQPSIGRAIIVAMQTCRHYGGSNCQIVNINNQAFKVKPSNYLPDSHKSRHRCKDLEISQAYSYLANGHFYLDADGDGHPCEWSTSSTVFQPTNSSSSGRCHWVDGYYRKNGSYVKGHQRCR